MVGNESASSGGTLPGNVRVGAVQWHMRPFESADAFFAHMRFFVRTLAEYRCEFVLFPEYFTVPLLTLHDTASEAEAARVLAGYAPRLRAEASALAREFGVDIIAGSTAVIDNDALFNVAYLCHRDGRIDSQYKIHPTPNEKTSAQMQGGDTLRVFDTARGRVAILICYDSEFPELARLLARHEIDILFVPYWTDTRHAHLRVRYCAQARAIENECYVVTAGSFGVLPGVPNVDIQYAQSAILSPSDAGFAPDAIVAEATANTEMTIFADLDLARLRWLREHGAVRNARDRRHDLYTLTWSGN
jgi:predicted amidohydrolase